MIVTKVIATRFRNGEQHINLNKRWMQLSEDKFTGKFYDRKNKPDTYTIEMFDDIFYYKDTMPVVGPSASLASGTQSNNPGNIEKLQTLIFSPGSEIKGIPVVGKRFAIFDDDMVPYYDYSITAAIFKDSISCYVFSCHEKPNAGDYPVLKSLSTWFDRKTFNIVYREYRYQYSSMIFDFDVSIKVIMDYVNEKLIPKQISYSGFWDLPLRKQENVDFTIDF
ncbi:MAG: hypothetical protein IPP71_12785 [Bacteroidetes bacterium]|nr:hypothetical protein [Bacteroidota bacterium]